MSTFFPSSKTKNPSNQKQEAKADLTAAIVNFCLAYNELVAYRASLKVQEVVQKASDLAATTEEISASAEEISASTQQISAEMQLLKTGEQDNINKINSLADLAKDTGIILNSMVGNVNELVGQINDIEQISKNVSEIAGQTNLLSLNAAIEAARAGEHGRGFSVVAEEVRKLSEQTQTAVKEVKNISDQMNTKNQNTVGAVAGVKKTFERYLADTTSVAKVMSENMGIVEESVSAVENIAQAAQQQAVVTESLASVSEDLAQSANFGDALINEAKKLNSIVNPYVSLSASDNIISIMAARLNDHAHFLRGVVENAGKGLKTTSHNECQFGKWYKQEYDKYKNIKEYVAIDAPHRHFHEFAEALSKKASLDNVDKLVNCSLEILETFLKLSKAM